MKNFYPDLNLNPEQSALLNKDKTVASLFNQIDYWYSPGKTPTKLRVEKLGAMWLAKSHKDWQSELNLTRSQSARCIRALKMAGLISTKIMKFNAVPTTHIRCPLLEKKYAVKAANGCPISSKPMHENVQSITMTTTGMAITNKAINTNSAYAKSTNSSFQNSNGKDKGKIGESVASPPNSAPPPSSLESESKGCPMNNHVAVNGSQSLSDIAELLKKKKSSPAKPVAKLGSYSPVALVKYFHELCAFHHSDMQHAKPPTGKELGQAKKLQEYCTVGDVTDIISLVVQQWSTFHSRVNGAKGVYGPLNPHLGFLLTHFDVAMNCKDELEATPLPVSKPSKAWYDNEHTGQ